MGDDDGRDEVERAADGLVADGLAVRVGDRYRLTAAGFAAAAAAIERLAASRVAERERAGDDR